MRLIIGSELKADGRWLAEVWYIPKKANGVKGAFTKHQAHEGQIIAEGNLEIIFNGGGEYIKAYGQNREEAIAKAQALALKVIADRLENGELMAGPINITYPEENAYLIDKIKAFLADYISFFDIFDKERILQPTLLKVQKGEYLNEKERKILYEFIIKGVAIKALLKIKESIIIPDLNPVVVKKEGEVLNVYLKEILEYGSAFMHNADNMVVRRIYEDYFITKIIDDAPDIIRRAMILRQNFYKNKPSDKILQYCKESFFTFIYGFLNSSVILLRTVLETALKEKFNVDVGTFGKLNQYLHENGLISKEIYINNEKVNKKAVKAVHNLTEGIEISEKDAQYLIEIASKNLRLIFT
jgi:hypothetical protein